MGHREDINQLAEAFARCQRILTALGDANRLLDMLAHAKAMMGHLPDRSGNDDPSS